jgi:hypothetical protein
MVARNDITKIIYALPAVKVLFRAGTTENHAQANHDKDGEPV